MGLSGIAYAILVGLVPSFIWLFFWTREDGVQPEPRSLLAACFLGGALAVVTAIPLEQYVISLGVGTSMQYSLWALIEELVKFVAVGLIALRSASYDEPVDAMIYCIAVALGFAALENMLFIMGPLADGRLAEGLVTGNLRFIGATLVHVVSSALVGFTLGFTFYRGIAAKILGWTLGIAGAIAVHAAFNLSIVNTSSGETLRAFAWIWGAVVVLIVLFEEVKVVRPKLV